MSDVATCRSCQARVRWVRTKNSRMPLDYDPRPDGDIVIDSVGVARKVGRGEVPAGPRYRSHFGSCPQGKQWSGAGPDNGDRRRGPAGPTSTAFTVSELVDGIRSTQWHIKSGPDPEAQAIAMLYAAGQVLLERGRSVADIQELLARGLK